MSSHPSGQGLVAAASMALMLSADAAAAQQRGRGFYVEVDFGLTQAAGLGSTVVAVTTPTKCDRLLYADPAMAPNGLPECTDTTPKALSSTGFSPGPGFTGGFRAGYAVDPLRVELEYRARTHGPDESPLIESTTNQAVVSKSSEWSTVYPPTEALTDYGAHQLFANVHHDFTNDSRWTPSVGVGAGMARTSLQYSRRLLRKTIGEGYQDVDPPLTVADRPAAAAGTLSLLEPTVTGTVFGFQMLAGVDYAVGEGTSIGLGAHWARFGELTQGVTWTFVRSHAPVRADGVTPFSGDVTLDGLEYWAVTLGLKHRF